MKEMKIGAVIFDVDGVIVDSEYIFLNSITGFLKKNGINKEYNELAGFLGRPEKEITEIVRQEFGFTDQYTFEEVWEGIYGDYSLIMRSGKVPPMEGFLPFFSGLERKGIRTAVATSGTKAHLREITEGIHLETAFDVVVTIEDAGKGKPAPDIFLKAAEKLEELGIRRDEMAVIEDSPNGIKAAKKAGLFTFGFKGSKVVQETKEADREVYSFMEIEEIMEEKE